MSDECSIGGRDEILYDLEVDASLAAPGRRVLGAENGRPHRGRCLGRRGRPGSGGAVRPTSGSSWPAVPWSRDGDTRPCSTPEVVFPQRGDTDGLDYGYLIGPACQVLESELDRLLTARPAIADALVEALRAGGASEKQAEILALWKEGTLPTTLGVQCLVLLALRARP